VDVLAAIYSASPKLNAIEFYFLLHQETIPDPTLKQYPKVLFLSIEMPSQSTSVNPHNLTSSPWVYLNPYSAMPHTYLRMCLVAAQCTLFGFTMN